MRQTFFGRFKSIAGAALVGFGIFVFYQNLDRAVTQSAISGQALGVVLSVMLAVWRVWQAYAADHQRFLHSFIQHMLISSWPLLLVMVGSLLSRDVFTDSVNSSKKDCERVDRGAGHSTSK